MTIEEALQQTIDLQKQHYEDIRFIAHQAMSLNATLMQSQLTSIQGPPIEQQEFEEELDSALKAGEIG